MRGLTGAATYWDTSNGDFCKKFGCKFWGIYLAEARYLCYIIFTGMIILISDPRRGCYMGLHAFIFFSFFLFFLFSFFSATILSGPYLWNRCLQRLQIECAAWSCGLIVHCCLPSNSLCYFFFIYFFYIFPPRFCPGHISGTVTRRDSKLSVLLGPSCGLILHCCLPSNSLYPISTLPEHLHSTSLSYAETT